MIPERTDNEKKRLIFLLLWASFLFISSMQVGQRGIPASVSPPHLMQGMIVI
jgi:hypothetical protein